MAPLVSVILPVYNQEKFIEETIQSVLDQTFANYEFLIVDDGSTDNSVELIRKYAQSDKRIVFWTEVNKGKSMATNFLVDKAKGSWCAFLDADDIMLHQRLEVQVAFHQQYPEVDASSSNCFYINGEGSMFGTQRYKGLSSIAAFNHTIKNEEFITCAFTGLMVSTNAYRKSGGLRKQFEPCEDFEFFNRLTDRGFKLLIIQEVLMKYRIHSSAVTIREPLLIRDTITYVKYNTRMRREGKTEINFQQFLATQEELPAWVRFNRLRFQYSTIYFRNAGLAMLSKNYVSCALQMTTSFLLSPGYVFKKALNQLKW